MESEEELPGRKRFPPGTDPYFAVDSAPISEEWRKQTQQYIEGVPLLNRLLTRNLFKDITTITGEVGYPEGVGKDRKTNYIVDVLMGTDIMQARPFLQLTQEEFSNQFFNRMVRAGREITVVS